MFVSNSLYLSLQDNATAAHIAAEFKQVGVLRLLLETGFHVDYHNKVIFFALQCFNSYYYACFTISRVAHLCTKPRSIAVYPQPRSSSTEERM